VPGTILQQQKICNPLVAANSLDRLFEKLQLTMKQAYTFQIGLMPLQFESEEAIQSPEFSIIESLESEK
jgi:hypothetical protein